MSSEFLVPAPERIGFLLEQLLGRKIVTKQLKAWTPGPQAKSYLGLYRQESGDLAAVVALDLSLASNAAAALVLVPPGAVSDCIRAGQLSANLLENLGEVLNVCTRLFNSPGQPHVKLVSILQCPPDPPADALKLVAHPASQLHIEMSIAGYGGGKLGLFV